MLTDLEYNSSSRQPTMERVVLRTLQGPQLEPLPTACCISPHGRDRLRLISFPQKLLAGFRIAIQTSWSRGIQSERVYDEKRCYEIKLRGNPWSPILTESMIGAVDLCRLTIGIMRFMLSYGWILELSTHPQLTYNQDPWFFKKGNQETHVLMCGISFSKNDKIRIIDESPEVTEAVLSTIDEHWHRGLQLQIVHPNSDIREVQLKGRPWSNRKDKAHASALLMQLMLVLNNAGWNVYACVGNAVNRSTDSTFPSVEMNNWILKKAKSLHSK